MPGFSRVFLAVCLSATLHCALPAAANDTLSLFTTAAKKAASVQAEEGNDGALILIAECIQTLETSGHRLEQAEICATYDWVISQASIELFSSLGQVGMNDPSYKIALDYAPRITKMLLSGGRSADDPQIQEFVRLLKEHAFQVFLDARF